MEQILEETKQDTKSFLLGSNDLIGCEILTYELEVRLSCIGDFFSAPSAANEIFHMVMM